MWVANGWCARVSDLLCPIPLASANLHPALYMPVSPTERVLVTCQQSGFANQGVAAGEEPLTDVTLSSPGTGSGSAQLSPGCRTVCPSCPSDLRRGADRTAGHVLIVRFLTTVVK